MIGHFALWGIHGSDVYVYANPEGRLVCCACSLTGDCPTIGLDDVQVRSPRRMLAHLARHERSGDTVPVVCKRRLRREAGLTPPIQRPRRRKRNAATREE